jgi:hypothetical protein
MKAVINLARYPLDREGSADWNALVARAKAELADTGMFNLEEFVLADVARHAASEVAPIMESQSYTHKRLHNIYFKPDIPELAPPGAAKSGNDKSHRVR